MTTFTLPTKPGPSRLRQELTDHCETHGGNAILYSFAVQKADLFIADPRLRMLFQLAQVAEHKARRLHMANVRWTQSHDLPPPQPGMRLSPGFIAAAVAPYQPFGYPELLRLRRDIRTAGDQFKADLRRMAEHHPDLFAAGEMPELWQLTDAELRLIDETLELMRRAGADAADGDSLLADPWNGLSSRDWPLPGRDLPLPPYFGDRTKLRN